MKTVFFTVADANNLEYAKALEKSFKHFHPDIKFIIYGDKEIDETNIPRPEVFYLATPYFARTLIKEYDQVVKIDADSIVTAPLEILDNPETFDVGVVFNWTRDGISDNVKVWDIPAQAYFNNGFVVFRSAELIEHIWKLCTQSNFQNYPYREQDMLNIVCHYGNYKIKVIDRGDSWYGLQSKSEWVKAIMRDGHIVIPKGKDLFPIQDKILRCIHFAGGNVKKMNYKIFFPEECSTYIDSLTK
jgi:lipopolysaccharide biosynthesis glycosyltransferase